MRLKNRLQQLLCNYIHGDIYYMKEKRKKVYIKGGREENKEMKSLNKA